MIRQSGREHWLVTLAILVTIVACGAPGPSPNGSGGTPPGEVVPTSQGAEPSLRTWTVTVHSSQEQTEAELAVADASGLVTGAKETPQPSFGFGGRSVHLGLLPGDDRTLAVFVAVAGCQRQPSLALSRAENRLLVRLDPGPRAAGGCDAMAVEYGVLLSLSNPVALADLVTQDADADAVTWGVASVGTDGLTRPILIIDRTKRAIDIAPTAPDTIALGGDDIAVANPFGDATLTVGWTRDLCETEATLTIDEIGDSLGLSMHLARVEPKTCGLRQIAHAINLQFAFPVPAAAVTSSATHDQ